MNPFASGSAALVDGQRRSRAVHRRRGSTAREERRDSRNTRHAVKGQQSTLPALPSPGSGRPGHPVPFRSTPVSRSTPAIERQSDRVRRSAGVGLALSSRGDPRARSHSSRDLSPAVQQRDSRSLTRAAIVDYLHALGITDCYASSYLKAVPGSPHGYDVADPTRLNPEIGDETTYWAWIAALARARHGPHAGPRAESHGHRASRRTRGGSTSSRTARARASRASSTSSGTR